jgi:mono/diheme cytochrome c family protein
MLFGWVALVALLVAASCAAADAVPSSAPDRKPEERFREVLQLFQAKCVRCHGGKHTRADLDLRTLGGPLKGGESGPAVVPGKPQESLLFEKVHSGSMPPGKKDRLSEADLEILRRWITAGAPAGTAAGKKIASTQHDVLPVLLRRCTACHGPRRREGGLDLRTRAAMLRGGKSGSAIIPGKPDDSLVIRKVRAGEMPPRQRLVEASVKPIEPAETELLVRWIAAGAPELATDPDASASAPALTDRDRDFWAFRPPRAVAIPSVREQGRLRNPIDAFVQNKLEEHGLSLAPEADRATLLRRACFDLTGLPPEPHEVQAFLADNAPAAYEKVIDRLLASPHYGERWGRYWLDLAGYADSEGKREQDLPRPHAWRYRDYVIRAFNADKPYDRFLLEQLAGDELADYAKAAEITPEIYDNLVATGFLRMAPDATWANITGYLDDRLEVIADEIDVLGSTVLGLTMKCARCHNHKFDPISQRDYYRLAAIFKGAYDEYDWLKPDIRPGIGPVSMDVAPGRHLPFVTSAERRQWEAENARGHKTPEPRIHALWDRGEPSPTYIYRRGDPLNPGAIVGPGVPPVLSDPRTPFEVKPPWPGAHKTGRRLALARWVTRADHPLTARVLVNRVWKHHFGTGIVKTLANFGKAGSPPSHPELLDWLASEFVQRGWSLKAMHRLMMTSATYRQSSVVTAAQEERDPDNALCSRMPLVRLDAEALYDSLLRVAGRLDETPFGPADAAQVRPDGLTTVTPTTRGWRRLVYAQQMRKNLLTHLENFDYPQMNPNCVERRATTVAPQALQLMNSGMVQQLAAQFSARIRREVGTDPARQLDQVFLIAFGRPPSAEEQRTTADALALLTRQWTRRLADTGKGGPEEAASRALAAVCHAVLNSASFLYVD